MNKLNLGIVFFWCIISCFIPLDNAKLWAVERVAVNFQPPEDRDKPEKGTISGGSRPVENSCAPYSENSKDTLTALSPGQNLGLTMLKYPNLIVYIPSVKAQNAELSIFNAQMEGVYQTNLSISKYQGFVTLPLLNRINRTSNTTSLQTETRTIVLEKNKPYYWTLALICNESDRTEDVVVGGWIEYAKPSQDLQQQLNMVNGIRKVSLLAKNGYWYDALSELLEMRRKNPNDQNLAQIWQQLFKSVGLEKISKKPINEPRLVTTNKYVEK
ncbi:MAG: DUF928 domain-containing protein [Cyanobacteria bacterium P01_A01_bin.45]